MSKNQHFFTFLAVIAYCLAAASIARADTAPGSPGPDLKGLELARSLNETYVHIASQVSASVVVITVTEKSHSGGRSVDSYDYTEDPWEEFRRFLQQRDGEIPPSSPKAISEGSGIIIRKDGFILTNRHVVEDAERVEVRLQDGRIFQGEVRGEDAPADVAVVKIDGSEFPAAKLGDSSKTRVGEMAMAIGAPFSLDYSTTFGHISAKHRGNLSSDSENGQTIQDQDFIQTDASINPGNSGGPLVNIEGEVIGVNTLIRGLHTGIGFAIPINLAREIADRLIRDGKFPRPYLGISIKSLKEYPDYRDFLQHSVPDGVLVTEISLDGPAASSNLKVEDIVTAVDGKPLTTVQQFRDEIRQKKTGKEIALDVLRKTPDGRKHLRINLRPEPWAPNAEIKEEDAQQAQGNPFGLVAKPISTELARKYNLQVSEGVVITRIDKTGPAYTAGMNEGDVIVSISDGPITNIRQYHDLVKKIDLQKGCIIHFISQGIRKFEIIRGDKN